MTELDTHELELLDSLRGLARAVRRNTGLFAAYEETFHEDCTIAEVWIAEPSGNSTHTTFRGSTRPYLDPEMTLQAARDALTNWLGEKLQIAERLKQVDADLDNFWGEDEPKGLSEDLAVAMETSS